MAAERTGPDPLEPYRAKRAVERIARTAGVARRRRGDLLVFHKHAASQSPLGPAPRDGRGPPIMGGAARARRSTRPTSDSRCMVEDHPLEYGDFEGSSPRATTAPAAVIIWDRGELGAGRGSGAKGCQKGKLLFDLHGHKLKGSWTLVKIK